jgi:hypothetical protein
MSLRNLETDLGRHVLPNPPELGIENCKMVLVDRPRGKGSATGLTPAGRLLCSYSERLLALCEDAVTALEDLRDVKTGQMYVAASQTTGIHLMPKLIGAAALPSDVFHHAPAAPAALACLLPLCFWPTAWPWPCGCLSAPAASPAATPARTRRLHSGGRQGLGLPCRC